MKKFFDKILSAFKLTRTTTQVIPSVFGLWPQTKNVYRKSFTLFDRLTMYGNRQLDFTLQTTKARLDPFLLVKMLFYKTS